MVQMSFENSMVFLGGSMEPPPPPDPDGSKSTLVTYVLMCCYLSNALAHTGTEKRITHLYSNYIRLAYWNLKIKCRIKYRWLVIDTYELLQTSQL